MAAASVSGLSGMAMLAVAYGREGLARGLACWILAAMLLVEAWIAVGPGARRCSGASLGFGFAVSEPACRSVFGAGAVVVAGFLVLAVRSWMRGRPGR